MNVRPVEERLVHERSLELAAAAIDFELTSAEATELAAHLSGCSTCSRTAAALRADASRLSTPLGVLPSSRVDAAIHAGIARPGASSRGLVLVAAAALLLLALLGAMTVGAYVLRTWQTVPTVVLPPTPSPAAIVSPGPSASPPAAGEIWESIDFTEGSNGIIEAITFSGTDLVGVGRGACVPDFADPTVCYGAAWTAGIGEPWTKAPEQDGLTVAPGGVTSGPQTGILDVAAGPAGIVAIGYPYDDLWTGIWRSSDGKTWERVQVTFGSSPGDAFRYRVAAIAASARGYVIVGYVIDNAAGPERLGRAASWTSADGVNWTRATDTSDMDVGPCIDTGEDPDCGGMRAVVATGSGFVAVGVAHTGSSPAQRRPAAWTSEDGLRWTRADDGLDVSGTLSGVTTGGRGLVAVGNADGRGVAATSVDGSTWRVATVIGATALQDVAATGTRMFAIGVRDPAEIQLWQSDDGIAWQRVEGLPWIAGASQYNGVDVAAAAGRVVVVGWGMSADLDSWRTVSYSSQP